MPIYSYKGLDASGKEIKKTINTDSIITAKQKIRSQGIMLIDIKEQKAKNSGGAGSGLNFGTGIKVDDIALMTRQLSTLVKAKIQIVDALAALEDQVENNHLRIILSEVKQDVNEGSSLAQALQKHPRVFNNVYINMVEAGEASGTLEIVLLRLADFTEAQMKLKTRIKSAMFYPIVMVVFGVIMMNIIMIFVIPKIAKILSSMKKDLPWATEFAIWLSDFLQNYWWLLIMAIIGAFFLLKKYIATTSGKRNSDALLLKLPILGGLIKMINVSRFCSTLATLLNSGVPILTSLTIVKNLIPNVLLKDAVESSRMTVSEGGSMAQPLKQSGLFPAMMTHMITLGERSGELEDMLNIVAENYEDQVDSKISGLTSILEPIMMVGMGLAVAFIVFAVVMPLMQMSQVQ